MAKRSFLQMDLFARSAEARRWMGSRRRMVLSDCTLWRTLPQMDRAQLREELQQAHVLLRRQGFGKVVLPGGREMRALIVDGSQFGRQSASVLLVPGEPVNLLDLEPSPGKGHELACSEAVLCRAFARHGQGLAEIVLGDGLYFTEGMLRLCREDLKTHLLVKCKGDEGERLLILQDAQGIFDAAPEFDPEVEHVRGVDAQRGMDYEIWAAKGFHHGDFPEPLKVARVRIRMLKGRRKNQDEWFWVVTTDESLRAEQMRELAHVRWSIENHGFRALNGLDRSKRVWVRGKQAREAFEAMMLILFLTFSLTLAYRANMDKQILWDQYRLRHISLVSLAKFWLLSLPSAEGWGFAAG